MKFEPPLGRAEPTADFAFRFRPFFKTMEQPAQAQACAFVPIIMKPFAVLAYSFVNATLVDPAAPISTDFAPDAAPQ